MKTKNNTSANISSCTAVALAALLLAFSGCTASQTWKQVSGAELEGKWQPGRSIEYARSLQKMLSAEHVPTRLVIYQRYAPGRMVEKGFRHGAVLYRDAATPDYPWWFMDNESVTPHWLPNSSIARQVRFSDPSLLRVVDVKLGGAPCGHPEKKHASIARDDWEAQFKKRHGTKFNALSEADQRKMREIKLWNWTRTAVL